MKSQAESVWPLGGMSKWALGSFPGHPTEQEGQVLVSKHRISQKH